MTEREVLQNAADQAGKTARAGREFAGLLDEYAKFLMQPNWRQRAEEYHRSALNKLNVINEGLAVCRRLIEESATAATADSAKQESQKQAVLNQQREKQTTMKKASPEKPERLPIRIAKSRR